MGRRGPRPGSVDTKGEILAAATAVFVRDGYDKASMRAVAREAGVDPALVRHYFAQKTELFVESMRPRIDLSEHAERLAAGEPDLVGERVMTFFVSVWDDPVQGGRILRIMHTALSHQEVGRLVRKIVIEGVIEPVATRMGAPDPAMAAVMTMSQVFGIAMMRYAAKIEPLASMPSERLVALYAPHITRLLHGQTS